MYSVHNFDSDDINNLLSKLDIINQQEFEYAKEIIKKAVSINESKEYKYVGDFVTCDCCIKVYRYLDRIFLFPTNYMRIRCRFL